MEVRNYSRIEDDTEVIALMPSVDEAVEWVRAQMDMGLSLEGDYYVYDNGRRTYLTSEGFSKMLSVEETQLVGQLIRCAHFSNAPTLQEISQRLQTEFGWKR